MMSVCNNTYAIRRWKGAYYLQENNRKRWVYGDLLLTHEGLRCILIKDERNKEATTLDFTLRFTDISQLMKAKSMFIYDAIVLLIGTTQHWLSSLQNRDAVYNILEHFWKDRLTPKTEAKKPIPQMDRTKRGQEMLKLAADSESTLSNAATILHRQGEQLDQAASNMFDLHNDLDVAENLVSGLESWVGRWSVPGLKYTSESLEIIQREDIPDFVEIPVLFTSHKRPSDFLARRGVCRVSKEGITIMDDHQCLIQHYQPRYVSMLRILSPWEMIISKYMIGQPDVAYTLVSVQLLELLKALEPQYRRQIQYDNPPSEIDTQILAKRCEAQQQMQRRSSKGESLGRMKHVFLLSVYSW